MFKMLNISNLKESLAIDQKKIAIAQRLKIERKKKKLNQMQLAEILNYSRTTIGNWEKVPKDKSSDSKAVNTIPQLTDLLILCELYDCDIEYLLCQTDIKRISSALLSPLYGLTDSTLEQLKNDFSQISQYTLDEDEDDKGNFEMFALENYFKLEFFSFINHLIQELLSAEINFYLDMEELNRSFQKEPYRKIIRNSFETVYMMMNKYPPHYNDKKTEEELLNRLETELKKNKIPEQKIAKIVNNSIQYIPLISSDLYHKAKTSFNMSIESAVSSYLENREQIESEYTDYCYGMIINQ